MNRKILKRMFNYFFTICFITFIVLFTSQKTGYAEYQNAKQVALTDKQIKKFEADVSKGKQVDIEKYLKVNNPDYQNKLSKLGLKMSEITGKGIKKIVSGSFKFLSSLDK